MWSNGFACTVSLGSVLCTGLSSISAANCKASRKTNKCHSVVNDASGVVATNVRGLCNNQSLEVLY